MGDHGERNQAQATHEEADYKADPEMDDQADEAENPVWLSTSKARSPR